MYEFELERQNQRKKYTIIGLTMFVVAMFVIGVIIGSSFSLYNATSKINQLQNQILAQQNMKGSTDVTTIMYVYNETSLTSIYENVRDSIVVIYGYVASYSFFGMQYSEVQGSGFIYEYNDQIVVITNQHVVEDALDLVVTFADGDAYPATVIGSDSYSDLAVLSVQAPDEEFKSLKIISSSFLNVGDPVIAIGSPFGLGGTMTTGIISQLGRTIQETSSGSYPIANIIQTSVPINPGNSGGPLLNYQGEVIGITTAIIEDSTGLGFAIPSNTILREIESLITTGSYEMHPWLGVSGVDMKYSLAQKIGIDVTYGWLITYITEDGAADSAGLQAGDKQIIVDNERVITGGDIIIAVDGVRIINGDSLMSYLEEYTIPGQIITITVLRDNTFMDIALKLGSRPLLT